MMCGAGMGESCKGKKKEGVAILMSGRMREGIAESTNGQHVYVE